MHHSARLVTIAALSLLPLASCASAQPSVAARPGAAPSSADTLRDTLASPPSELAEAINQFQADWGILDRTYRVGTSPQRRERMVALCKSWLEQLDGVDISHLSQPGKVDYTLFRNHVAHQKRLLETEQDRYAKIASRVPFADTIFQLEDARRLGAPLDYEKTAGTLDALKQSVDAAKAAFETALKPPAEGVPSELTPTTSKQVLDVVDSLQWDLVEWHDFYDSYDPQFTWWTQKPYGAALDSLRAMSTLVKEKGVGITADNPNVIVGTPIGRDALIEELGFAMIPYTPEELLAIAEREAAWCHEELKKAARDMGMGDDWKAALEKIKLEHVAPGEQPELIRDLAKEAVAFVREHDLVTVPPLAEETWRMDMMSPDRQLVTPFFTGGEVISVAFPTATMEHQQKLMSLRGNNRHFARATVLHELIPGHYLQQYMQSRWRTYRDPFSTPFWTEGWALYWEMRMWDLNFPKSPENRVGALFWRMHRCARIVFSLKYQLGEWSPQQCIDYLISEVGHEKANAEGEVRRSVSGGYGPLYQAAYMLGGLQIRALHNELVGPGKMSEKQFHDAILHENNIPIEMTRALLTKQDLPKDFRTSWRFDDKK